MVNQNDPASKPLLVATICIGVFSLFPYNSFLSSATYFQHYYQYAAVEHTDNVADLPVTTNTSFWENASNWAMVVMILAMTIFQFLMVSPFMLHRNVRIRILGGAVILLVAMMLMPVCAVKGGVSEEASIAVLLLASFLSGTGTSILQGSCYGLFSTLPTVYVTSLALGGGIAGTFNSLLRIIIHYALPTTFAGIKKGAVVFYCVGIALLVAACVLVVLLGYHPLLQECCTAFRPGLSMFADPPREEKHIEAHEPRIDEPQDISLPHEPVELVAIPSMSCGEENTDDTSSTTRPLSVEGENDGSWSVTKRIWPMMLGGLLTFGVSLVFFPRLGVKAIPEKSRVVVAATNGGWEEEDVMPIVVILMYNIGDFLGRLLPLRRSLWLPKRWIFVLLPLRVVVVTVPLALGFTNPKVINSVANPMIMFAIMGLSNGYLLGTCIGYGCSDEKLRTESEHATAGTCMVFAFLFGCFFGSVISLVVLITVW